MFIANCAANLSLSARLLARVEHEKSFQFIVRVAGLALDKKISDCAESPQWIGVMRGKLNHLPLLIAAYPAD